MRKIATGSLVAAVLALSASLVAQDLPAAPEPTEGHEWLRRLVGEWEAVVEVATQPGQPPLRVESTETTRPIGRSWILVEGETKAAAMPFARALILGYDPAKEKYVGTWVDSNSTHIGTYEGERTAGGETLTLVGEIPHPHDGARLVEVREVIELKSQDHKVITTSLRGDDGNWFTLVTVDARRKK